MKDQLQKLVDGEFTLDSLIEKVSSSFDPRHEQNRNVSVHAGTYDNDDESLGDVDDEEYGSPGLTMYKWPRGSHESRAPRSSHSNVASTAPHGREG